MSSCTLAGSKLALAVPASLGHARARGAPLPALPQVRFAPQAARVGMQDDSLLALATNLGVKTLHLPFQPRPDRAVPVLADGVAHVEVVVEGLHATLR